MSTRSANGPRPNPRRTDGGRWGVTLDVLIRSAQAGDAVAIGTVWQRAAMVGYEGIFPPDAPTPTRELLAERSRQAIAAQGHSALVLVACDSGPDHNVVGTIAVTPDPHEGSRAQLRRLYVDPGYWGRGIGRRLHDEVLAHVRQAGYRVVVLWVLERNVRARAMYERWGWQATPARHAAHPGVDEICYLMTL